MVESGCTPLGARNESTLSWPAMDHKGLVRGQIGEGGRAPCPQAMQQGGRSGGDWLGPRALLGRALSGRPVAARLWTARGGGCAATALPAGCLGSGCARAGLVVGALLPIALLLPALPSELAGRSQALVAQFPDLLVATLQLVSGRDVAKGAVQPPLVVFLDVSCDQSPGLGLVAGVGQPHEDLEVLGDKLRPVVADDARSRRGELLAGGLQDALDVQLRHLRT